MILPDNLEASSDCGKESCLDGELSSDDEKFDKKTHGVYEKVCFLSEKDKYLQKDATSVANKEAEPAVIAEAVDVVDVVEANDADADVEPDAEDEGSSEVSSSLPGKDDELDMDLCARIYGKMGTVRHLMSHSSMLKELMQSKWIVKTQSPTQSSSTSPDVLLNCQHTTL